MSEENMEVLRRSFDLFNSGGPDAVFSAGLWSPDLVWDVAPAGDVDLQILALKLTAR